MRAWQIIVASAVAASIAAAALFVPEATQSSRDAMATLQTYWLGAAIIWLGAYSVAAVILSTATALGELGEARSDQVAPPWPLRYLLRLAVTHYFSAVLVLLALGLLPVAATEPLFPVPYPIGLSPALTVCAGAILAGVVCWLIATIVAAFRAPAIWGAAPAAGDAQSLHEIVELLRGRSVEPVPAAASLVEQIQQRDRVTLEAIGELAALVGRVRAGVAEIQQGLQNRASLPAGQEDAVASIDIAAAAGELRTAATAITAAVTKLEEIAAGLAALSPLGGAGTGRGVLPAGSRSQLSNELQELLRDMAPGSAPRQEGSR
jgi:hypothetical protein